MTCKTIVLAVLFLGSSARGESPSKKAGVCYVGVGDSFAPQLGFCSWDNLFVIETSYINAKLENSDGQLVRRSGFGLALNRYVTDSYEGMFAGLFRHDVGDEVLSGLRLGYRLQDRLAPSINTFAVGIQAVAWSARPGVYFPRLYFDVGLLLQPSL